MRGGPCQTGSMRRGLTSRILCAALTCALPWGCVVHTRDGRVLLPGERERSGGRYAWSPFGDLLETVLAPVFLPLTPVFWAAGWWSGTEARWNAMALLLPGFCRHQCAFFSWLEPAQGFHSPFPGSQAALAAELGRCTGRSVVVAPEVGRLRPGQRPATLEELAAKASLQLLEVDGVLVLRPAPGGPPHHLLSLESVTGPPLVMAPDVWPSETARAGERGEVVVLRKGPGHRTTEVLRAANERRWRPAFPAPEARRGQEVRLSARDEPLRAAAARLSELGGRPIALEGGDGDERVSFHLESVGWEQALAALAWAADRRLELDARGNATLVARRRISAAIRWAHPLVALELLARAAGRRLVLPDPAPALQPTALHLSQVEAEEALQRAAELLGFALEPDGAGALAVRRLPGAVPFERRPVGPVAVEWGDRRPQLEAFLREQLARVVDEQVSPPERTGRPNVFFGAGLPCNGCHQRLEKERRLLGSGRREWELLERRLETWLPTWNPHLPGEAIALLAKAVVDRELTTLDQALQQGEPDAVLAALPELTELAARLARRDRSAAGRLLEGARARADEAHALAVLLARSPAVVQGTLRGPELELAIVDGQVVAPGEPLIDRAGAVRRSAVLIGVPELDRVAIECDGRVLVRRLPE